MSSSFLYSWGSGSNGQLSLGNTLDISVPSKVDQHVFDISQLKEISLGGSHSLFLLNSENQLYSCGLNDSGQLGLGEDCTLNELNSESLPITSLPRPVLFFKENKIQIRSLASGWNFSIITDDQLKIWSFGSNSHCQLGLGTGAGPKKKIVLRRKSTTNTTTPSASPSKNYYKPIQVEFFISNRINVLKVACGMRHCISLADTGDVYGWGCNKYGQLIKEELECDLIEQPKLLKGSLNHHKIKDISTGQRHSLLLSANDECLISFGNNRYGQLGRGNFESDGVNIIPISSFIVLGGTGDNQMKKHNIQCGWNTSFIQIDELLYCCGRNDYGQLGNGSSANSPIFIQSPSNQKVISYSTGSEHTLFFNEKNEIFGFGWNEHFQLGLGEPVIPGIDGINQLTPILISKQPSPNDNIQLLLSGSGSSYLKLVQETHETYSGQQ